MFTERNSIDYMVACLKGPEVALPGKPDRDRTSNEINTHDVPHLLYLFVEAWIRLNEICQDFEDHIEDS